MVSDGGKRGLGIDASFIDPFAKSSDNLPRVEVQSVKRYRKEESSRLCKMYGYVRFPLSLALGTTIFLHDR